ncbi:MAG: hypothetical protein Kow00124_15630 [Anaerolineae bacterium]
MTRTYRIPDQALEQIRQQIGRQIRLFRIALPLIGLAALLGFGLAGTFSWPVLIGLYLLYLIILGIGSMLYRRAQFDSWATLRIMLDDDGITRLEAGRKPVVVPYSSIVGLHDVPGGPLVVVYGSRRKSLGIPREIESFALIKQQIEAQIKL